MMHYIMGMLMILRGDFEDDGNWSDFLRGCLWVELEGYFAILGR